MRIALLIIGLICLGLSFVIHVYFLQFLVIGILLLGFYLANSQKKEVDALKKLIKEHNELMRKDIEELKKSG